MAAVRGFAAPEGLVAVLKAVRPLLDDLRFAAAAAEYRHAIAAGHVRCRAELAWLLLWGRDGIPEDKQLAFRLAFEGVRQGLRSQLRRVSPGAQAASKIHPEPCSWRARARQPAADSIIRAVCHAQTAFRRAG